MNPKTLSFAAILLVAAAPAISQTRLWNGELLTDHYARQQVENANREYQEAQYRQQQANEQARRSQNNRQYELEEQVRDLQKSQRKSNTGYYSEYYSDK